MLNNRVDKVLPRDHIFSILLTMKIFSACCILLGVSLPAFAAQTSPSHPANPKPHASAPADTASAERSHPGPRRTGSGHSPVRNDADPEPDA